MSVINCYTDGACKNNKNSKKQSLDGGSGGIIIYNDNSKFFMKKIKNATNNIAELNALLECLKILNNDKKNDRLIYIYTDSMYSINCLTKWYLNWEKNNWKTSNGKDVLNKELIKEILELKNKFNHLYIKYVKGHSDHKENDLADKFANDALLLENYDVVVKEYK